MKIFWDTANVDHIREATLDELAAVPGMTRKIAERIKEFL